MLRLWRGLRFVWRVIWKTFALILIALFLQRSTYPLHIDWNAISVLVGGNKFDYVSWEVNALATKAGQALWGNHPYMDEAARSDFVQNYMRDLGQAMQLTAQVEAIYLDLSIADPDAASAELRVERDALRADLDRRQATAESILEGQVSAILADEGFAVMGQVMPPVSMHFTRMPNLLVVSPRDRIERRVELAIDPMPLEDIIALEDRIFAQQDMDAVVIPLGGMAIFPAMIRETANLPWAIETFAHEWVHHYFFFYPLGLSFFVDTGPGGREAVAINETAANLFGKYIGEKVVARYYPEFLPETSIPQVISVQYQDPVPTEETPFEFGRAMHETRTGVDTMLSQVQLIQAKVNKLHRLGYVDDAQTLEAVATEQIDRITAFLAARRQLFYDNGFNIRRLNLAYFAFYGGYQAEGIPGIAGTDPIGPAVQDIFDLSPDIRAFVVTMRDITTREELLSVQAAMQAEYNQQAG